MTNQIIESSQNIVFMTMESIDSCVVVTENFNATTDPATASKPLVLAGSYVPVSKPPSAWGVVPQGPPLPGERGLRGDFEPRYLTEEEFIELDKMYNSDGKKRVDLSKVTVDVGFIWECNPYHSDSCSPGEATGLTVSTTELNVHSGFYGDLSIEQRLALLIHEGTHALQNQHGGGFGKSLLEQVGSIVSDPYEFPTDSKELSRLTWATLTNEQQAMILQNQFLLNRGRLDSTLPRIQDQAVIEGLYKEFKATVPAVHAVKAIDK